MIDQGPPLVGTQTTFGGAKTTPINGPGVKQKKGVHLPRRVESYALWAVVVTDRPSKATPRPPVSCCFFLLGGCLIVKVRHVGLRPQLNSASRKICFKANNHGSLSTQPGREQCTRLRRPAPYLLRLKDSPSFQFGKS